jgi:hypothetical protein
MATAKISTNGTVKVITPNGIETRRIFNLRKIAGGRTGRVSLGGKMVRVWKMGPGRKAYSLTPPACNN